MAIEYVKLTPAFGGAGQMRGLRLDPAQVVPRHRTAHAINAGRHVLAKRMAIRLKAGPHVAEFVKYARASERLACRAGGDFASLVLLTDEAGLCRLLDEMVDDIAILGLANAKAVVNGTPLSDPTGPTLDDILASGDRESPWPLGDLLAEDDSGAAFEPETKRPSCAEKALAQILAESADRDCARDAA